jgi:hypothetical protein
MRTYLKHRHPGRYVSKISNGRYILKHKPMHRLVPKFAKNTGFLSIVRPKDRELVKKLQKEKPKNLKYDGQYFSLNYDGDKIRNKVKIVPHEKWVANWKLHQDEIVVDDDMFRTSDKKILNSLMMHESIEKHVAQKYGLRGDTEAHMVAEGVEFNTAKKNGTDWLNYDLLVDGVGKREYRKYCKDHQTR